MYNFDALRLEKCSDEYLIATNFPEVFKHPVIRLDQTTSGAAETALLTLKRRVRDPGNENSTFFKDSSLLLLDCDAIYHCDVISKFRELENSSSDTKAGVICFREPENKSKPKYSYVDITATGAVLKIAEKERVGPLANTGAYWFASCKEFEEITSHVIAHGDFQLGEAYVSCVLREYLARGAGVRAVIISEDEYSNIGTPECLEKYLSKQEDYAFLFDLDGTLVDTTTAYVEAWKQLLAPRGAHVDEDFFVRHISGLSDSQVSEKFKIPVSSSEKDEYFIKNISSVIEIPGAAAFVRKCQQIGLVHVVTNSNQQAAMALLDRLGLNDLPLLTAQDVRIGKPNPEPYSKAMRTLGVSPTKCLVFEDSRGGMISGRAARAQYVIAVNNNLKNCDVFLSDFNGVDPAELIDRLVSVSHLSEELSELLGQKSMVYPIRASGGYISEILTASSGSRNLVIKQENSNHGALQEVSEYLNLHDTECIFYRDFASMSPIRTPTCYGVLPKSHAIVMEDLRQYDRAPEFALDSGLKVVKSVAKLHSHFRGTPLGELSTHSTYMKKHVLDNYPKFKAKWLGTVSEETFELFDHAVKYYEDAEVHLLTPPNTLLHGDLKFPNLFWDNAVSGGEPIFIDWQYAGPGKGIEDIAFLLVESCDTSDFQSLAGTLITAYYAEVQKYEEVEVPPVERQAQVSCALAGFPLFVAVWFGCIDANRLSEPNFPFLYILRLANAFANLYDVNWVRYKLQ